MDLGERRLLLREQLRLLIAIATVALTAACDDPLASTRAAIVTPERASDEEAIVAIIAHDPTCAPAPPALVCTGTLIAPDAVLTAAHCLAGVRPDALDVVFGAALSGARVRVRAGAAHPAFDPTTHDNDIAVLRLAARSSVAPLAARRDPVDASRVGEKLSIVGYGGAPSGGEGTREHGTVELAAIEPRALRLLPSPSMTCRGDSGGPVLAADGQLIGVTTHGDPACREVGFAARVDAYAAFIDGELARAYEDGGRAFDATEDLCRASCSSDRDCAAGLVCVEGRCALGGLPPGRFTAACSEGCAGDQPCVRVADGCRCFEPCTAVETPSKPDTGSAATSVGGGGCAFGHASGGAPAALALLLLLARSRCARA